MHVKLRAASYGKCIVAGVVGCIALQFWGDAAAQLAERLKTCAGCHGDAGNSTTEGVPSLAGQPRVFIETQLILFREGVRPQEPMSTLMRGVSDKEIIALAAYYATAKPAPATGRKDAARFKRGAAIVKQMQCGACHLADFRGREQMPRLAGQREEYLNAAMLAYRDNRRIGSDTMMNSVLYGVADADIKAIAHFLSHSR